MLYVSAESLSWGVVVGGAIGGGFGTMTGIADDAEKVEKEPEEGDAWWQPDVPAGLELLLVAGGLIAYVLAADAGWLFSMGEAGSLLLGPSLGSLSVVAWNRTVGSD